MTETARDVKPGERKQLAKGGKANADGSFPIKTVQDLKNAIAAFGRSKDKAKTKALIMRRAKALNATNLIPSSWRASDSAGVNAGLIDCPGHECARYFATEEALEDHADAVHTFDDIREMVREVVREKYYQPGDYRVTPVVESQWAWVRDLAADWVVFELSKGENSTLYKASYTITDGAVTLGEGVEVQKRTVYDEVKES